MTEEPDGQDLYGVVVNARVCLLSAASYVEMALVLSRYPALSKGLDGFLTLAGIEVAPFSAAQARIARGAFERFGKGRHPAGLNLGDCYAYALARFMDSPLLFKGNDFSKTDLRAAVQS